MTITEKYNAKLTPLVRDAHVSISSFEFAPSIGSGQVCTTRRRTRAVTVNCKAANDAEGRVAA